MSVSGVVVIAWAVFWAIWLISALGAKHGSRSGGFRRPSLLILVTFVVLRAFDINSLVVHSPALEAVGLVLLACGLGLALLARFYLGRNWGMPMTTKDEPELVSSGPYRLVRHPIYSGLLLAILGTALATNILYLIALALFGAYFIYSATVEERLMTSSFPKEYPSYQARTKMLIPFVL